MRAIIAAAMLALAAAAGERGVLTEIDMSGDLPRACVCAPAGATMKDDPDGWRNLHFGAAVEQLTNCGVRAELAAARRGWVEYRAASLPPFGGVPLRAARLVYKTAGSNITGLVHLRFFADGQNYRKLAGAFKRRFGQPDRIVEDDGTLDTWIGRKTMISILHLYGADVQVDVISTAMMRVVRQ